MNRVKILIMSGAFVAATATATGNIVSQEQSAERKNVETVANVKNAPEKKICWKSINSKARKGKTVMYCGTCTQLAGKRTLFSLPGRTAKFSKKYQLAGN